MSRMSKRILLAVVMVCALGAIAWARLTQTTPEVTTTSEAAREKYNEGMVAMRSAYNADAARCWKEALREDPAFPMALTRLATFALLDGDVEQARALQARAEEGLDRVTDLERLRIQMVRTRIDRDDERHKELARRIVARKPDDVEALFVLSRQAKRDGNLEESARLLQQILEFVPGNGFAYNELGYTLADLDRLGEAQETFQKYVFLAPDEANPRDSLGELYLRLGRYADAEAQFRAAAELKPDFAWAYIHLAMVLQREGRYREALAALQRARETGPLVMTAPVLTDVAVSVLAENGQWIEALEWATTFSRDYPKNLDRHLLLACVQAGLGNSQEVRGTLDRFLEEARRQALEANGKPEEIEEYLSVHFLRALAAQSEGDLVQAQISFQRGLEIPAIHWDVAEMTRVHLLDVQVQAQAFSLALETSEVILRNNPRHSRALLARARACEGLGRLEEAARSYQAVLEVLRGADPGARLVREAESGLQRVMQVPAT